MTEDEVWKRRFLLFMLVRLSALALVLAGVAVAMTDWVADGRLALPRRRDRAAWRRPNCWSCRSCCASRGSRVKRFWSEVAVAEAEGGLGIALDGRPLKTPARATLLVPSRALAEAIADEWRDVRRGDRSARDAADRARQCRDRPGRARPRQFRRQSRALRRGRPVLLPRRISAVARRARRRQAGIRCLAGRGGGSMSTSRSAPASSISTSRRRRCSGLPMRWPRSTRSGSRPCRRW